MSGTTPEDSEWAGCTSEGTNEVVSVVDARISLLVILCLTSKNGGRLLDRSSFQRTSEHRTSYISIIKASGVVFVILCLTSEVCALIRMRYGNRAEASTLVSDGTSSRERGRL